jgi:hypothetical protein
MEEYTEFFQPSSLANSQSKWILNYQ